MSVSNVKIIIRNKNTATHYRINSIMLVTLSCRLPMFTFHPKPSSNSKRDVILKGLHYSVNVYLQPCRFHLLNSNDTKKMSFKRLFRFLCLKKKSYVNNKMNIRLNLTK